MLKLSFVFNLIFAVIVHSDSLSKDQIFSFSITKQWDGKPTNFPPVGITLKEDTPGNQLIFSVKAPFFNDTKPEGTPGEPTKNMWKYEVVEVFFANEDDEYLQIEFGPHGHHLVLLFNGQRNLLHYMLPVDSETVMTKDSWEGTVNIPGEYFPPQVTRFNAFAMNGLIGDATRRYWALYPEDGSSSKPDFHQLKYFEPIDLKGPYAHQTEYSQTWLDAYANSGSGTTDALAAPKVHNLLITSLILISVKILFL